MRSRRAWIVMASLTIALVAVWCPFAQVPGGGGTDFGPDLSIHQFDYGTIIKYKDDTFLVPRDPINAFIKIDEGVDLEALDQSLTVDQYEEYVKALERLVELFGVELPEPTPEEWAEMSWLERRYHQALVKVAEVGDRFCTPGRLRPEKVQVSAGIGLSVSFVFDVERLCDG